MKRNGFTLIELLVVIAIIGIRLQYTACAYAHGSGTPLLPPNNLKQMGSYLTSTPMKRAVISRVHADERAQPCPLAARKAMNGSSYAPRCRRWSNT